jgi:tRNA threonylcarbamoyladenosine biosynthesis protein TsaB
MKTILTIETSTARGSVALVRGGNVLFNHEFTADRSHNSLIFSPLEAALRTADPELIVVGTGPGSYTGVRVGLAAAIGLALARNIPLIGWPSLLAFDAPAYCHVIGDARRGSYFLAEIEGGRLLTEPHLLSANELAARVKPPVFTFDDAPPLPGVQHAVPSALRLAQAAACLSSSEIESLSRKTPEPLYLRAPFTTTPKARGP